MSYYEIPVNPGLTLDAVREKLLERMPAVAGSIFRNHLLLFGESDFGVRVDLRQIPDGTLLCVQMLVSSRSFAVRMLVRALLPLAIVYLLLVPLVPNGAFSETESAILDAFPGAIRLPMGAGTRRARPGLYRFLGVLKFLCGLIVAAVGVGLANFWYNTSGLAPTQLLAAAIPAGLGLSFAYAGIRNMALSPLDLRRFAGAAFICTVLSPYLFKAFWTYEEHVFWNRIETNSGELYNYRILPRGLWRPDFCLQTAQMRADQRIKEGVKDDFVKEDLEMVVKAIYEFHPHRAAYQPAYRLAKSMLDSWDKH